MREAREMKMMKAIQVPAKGEKMKLVEILNAKEIDATLRFSVLTDVRPMIEIFPLERASEAYDKMMSAKTRFRAVLSISE
jgi:D-arabinose 1-dehydrogenase-like Zn-dependent alcohol dehydrogenase